MKDLLSKSSKINAFDPSFICFIFRSAELQQFFTSSKSQCSSYNMSSTSLTRQHARSSSNAELINHSELDVTEKANHARNSKKGKVPEMKPQTAVVLGQIA